MSGKKASSAKTQNPWVFVVLGIVGLLMSYGFASWAIDTGSLWLYLFCFISLYYGLDYIRKSLKATLFNNDNGKRQK